MVNGSRIIFKIFAEAGEAIASVVSVGHAVDTLGSKLKALDAITARPKIDADIASLEVKIAQAKEKIRELDARRANIQIDADTANAERKLVVFGAALTAMRKMRADPVIDPQIAAAQAKLVDISAKLNKLATMAPSPVVNLQTAIFNDQYAQTWAKISALDKLRANPTLEINISEMENKIAAVKTQLADLEARRVTTTVDANITLAEGKLAKLVAEMDALERKRVDPIVDLEIKAAETKITELEAQLTRLRSQAPTVEIDADIAQAEFKIAQLKARIETVRGSRVEIDADIAQVQAKIDLVRAELARLNAERVNPAVDLETAAAQAKLALLEAQLKALSGRRDLVDIDVNTAPAVQNLHILGTSAIALLTTLTPIGASLISILSPLLTLTPLVAVGIGAAALAFAGLGKAITAYESLEQKTGTAATKSASTQVAAAQQVAVAQEGVVAAQERVRSAQANAADAAVTAAERVKTAQQGVANAQRDAATSALDSAQRVKDAQRAVADAASAAADANEAAARRVKTAQENVGTAIADSANSIRSALDGQKSAEDALAQAQKDEKTAQEDLTLARKTAQDQIEALTFSLADNALNERAAVIRLQEARDKLNAGQTSGKLTGLQLAKAVLDVDQAQQQLIETQAKAVHLAEEKRAQDAAGIEGSKVVVAAQQNVARSMSDVGKAQTALQRATQDVARAQIDGANKVAKAQEALTLAQKDQIKTQEQGATRIARAQETAAKAQTDAGRAQISSAEKVAAAVQALGDAQRAQVKQARTGADSIAAAQRGVESAQRAVTAAQDAGAKSATVAASATNAYQLAMSKLSPAGREFVNFYETQMKPKLKELKEAASAGLLPGIETGFRNALPAFDKIKELIGGISKAMGTLAADAGRSLTGPVFQKFADFLIYIAPYAFKTFGQIAGQTFAGFSGLMQGFEPIFRQIGDGLVAMTGRFAAFGEKVAMKQDNGFADFIQYLKEAGPTVMRFLDAIGTFIGHFAEATQGIGITVLNAMSTLFEIINSVNPGILSTLIAAFLGLKTAAIAAAAVTALAGAFTALSASAGLATARIAAGVGVGTAGALAAGIRVEQGMAKAAGGLSKVAGALPLVGVALIGLMALFDNFGPHADRAAKAVSDGSLSMRQAIEKEADANASRVITFDRAAAKSEALANATKTVTEEYKKLYDAASPLERKQMDLNRAQADYYDALSRGSANDPAVLDALSKLKKAKTDLATETDKATAAEKSNTQALKDGQLAAEGIANSIVGYSNATIATRDAQRAQTDLAKEGKATADELTKASNDVTTAALSQAGAARKRAEDTSTATTADGKAADGNRAFRDELVKLSGQLTGDSKKAIDDTIKRVDGTSASLGLAVTKSGNLKDALADLASSTSGPIGDKIRAAASHIESLGGASASAETKARLQKDELFRLADAANGPVRQRLLELAANFVSSGDKADVARIRALGYKGQLDLIPPNKVTSFQTPGLDASQRAIYDFQRSLAALPPLLGIKFNTAFTAPRAMGGVVPPRGFALGGVAGVLPGYTPGKDIYTVGYAGGGAVGLSGGEAVMRPEWTAAVGRGFVDDANAAARAGGVDGARRYMNQVNPGGAGASTLGGNDRSNSMTISSPDVVAAVDRLGERLGRVERQVTITQNFTGVTDKNAAVKSAQALRTDAALGVFG